MIAQQQPTTTPPQLTHVPAMYEYGDAQAASTATLQPHLRVDQSAHAHHAASGAAASLPVITDDDMIEEHTVYNQQHQHQIPHRGNENMREYIRDVVNEFISRPSVTNVGISPPGSAPCPPLAQPTPARLPAVGFPSAPIEQTQSCFPFASCSRHASPASSTHGHTAQPPQRQCPECGLSFSNRRSFMKHMTSVHCWAISVQQEEQLRQLAPMTNTTVPTPPMNQQNHFNNSILGQYSPILPDRPMQSTPNHVGSIMPHTLVMNNSHPPPSASRFSDISSSRSLAADSPVPSLRDDSSVYERTPVSDGRRRIDEIAVSLSKRRRLNDLVVGTPVDNRLHNNSNDESRLDIDNIAVNEFGAAGHRQHCRNGDDATNTAC
ncbi:unnamed protein product [Sphagnum balticum]